MFQYAVPEWVGPYGGKYPTGDANISKSHDLFAACLRPTRLHTGLSWICAHSERTGSPTACGPDRLAKFFMAIRCSLQLTATVLGRVPGMDVQPLPVWWGSRAEVEVI